MKKTSFVPPSVDCNAKLKETAARQWEQPDAKHNVPNTSELSEFGEYVFKTMDAIKGRCIAACRNFLKPGTPMTQEEAELLGTMDQYNF